MAPDWSAELFGAFVTLLLFGLGVPYFFISASLSDGARRVIQREPWQQLSILMLPALLCLTGSGLLLFGFAPGGLERSRTAIASVATMMAVSLCGLVWFWAANARRSLAAEVMRRIETRIKRRIASGLRTEDLQRSLLLLAKEFDDAEDVRMAVGHLREVAFVVCSQVTYGGYGVSELVEGMHAIARSRAKEALCKPILLDTTVAICEVHSKVARDGRQDGQDARTCRRCLIGLATEALPEAAGVSIVNQLVGVGRDLTGLAEAFRVQHWLGITPYFIGRLAASFGRFTEASQADAIGAMAILLEARNVSAEAREVTVDLIARYKDDELALRRAFRKAQARVGDAVLSLESEVALQSGLERG